VTPALRHALGAAAATLLRAGVLALVGALAATLSAALSAQAAHAQDIAPPAKLAAAPRTAESAPRQILVMYAMPALHARADGAYAGAYADPAGRAALRRAASALARDHGLRVSNDWPMPTLGLDCYVMDVPAEQDADELAERLSHAPGVAWAQVSNVFRPLGGGHDDPLYALQPAAAPWHLAEAHAALSGAGVTLALVDSGVQLDHPDLLGQVAAQRNFVANRPAAAELHGTAVAGIVAARPDNGAGIAGIAPRVRLLALRACFQAAPDDTRCSSLSLALALQAAIEQGAQIVNLSLGGPADRLVRLLVEAAQARGATVVAAWDRAAPDGGFPAALDGVVAAADENGAPLRGGRAWLAPGTDVPTSVPPSRWASVSGSSYAAAHVSALLALMLEARERRGAAAGAPAADLVAHDAHAVDACASLRKAALECICACGRPGLGDSVARH